MKKGWLILIPLVTFFVLFLTAPSKVQGVELRPKWYFEPAGISYDYAGFAERRGMMPPESPIIQYGEGYLGKFVLSYGPIGVGIVVWECVGYTESAYNAFYIEDTLCTWAIQRNHYQSYFPIVLTFALYSNQLSFAKLSLHGYSKCSWWFSGKRDIYYRRPTCLSNRYFYRAYTPPASCLDVGTCLSLRPSRFLRPISFLLRLGILRIDYDYTVHEPFKRQMPSSTINRFYISCGISVMIMR